MGAPPPHPHLVGLRPPGAQGQGPYARGLGLWPRTNAQGPNVGQGPKCWPPASVAQNFFFGGLRTFFSASEKNIPKSFFSGEGVGQPLPRKKIPWKCLFWEGGKSRYPQPGAPWNPDSGITPHPEKKFPGNVFSEEGVGHPWLRKKEFCGPWAGARLSPVPGPGWACLWSRLGLSLVQVASQGGIGPKNWVWESEGS